MTSVTKSAATCLALLIVSPSWAMPRVSLGDAVDRLQGGNGEARVILAHHIEERFIKENDRRIALDKLKTGSDKEKEKAILTLAPLVTQDAQVMGAIIKQLNDFPMEAQESNWTFIPNRLIEALAPVIRDPQAKQAVTAKLKHNEEVVRSAALKVLAPLITEDESVRQAVLARLDDKSEIVQMEAVHRLRPLVATDGQVKQTVLRMLTRDNLGGYAANSTVIQLLAKDPDAKIALLGALESTPGRRGLVLEALSPWVKDDAAVKQVFLAELGNKEVSRENISQVSKRWLVEKLAPLCAEQEVYMALGRAESEDARKVLRGCEH